MTDIFVSRPTKIASEFQEGYKSFHQYLITQNLNPVRLGAGQYTLDAPLMGVIKLIQRCKGAIILGYPRYDFSAAISGYGVNNSQILMNLPTPWNHIEAALSFREPLPVLVIAHEGITGGVFDFGVTGQFVLTVNLSLIDWCKSEEFGGLFKVWKEQLNK